MTYEEDCYVVESGIIISPHLQLDPVEPPEEIVIIPPITECYVENPYRYAGYEYLENVALYDLNARYYDPNTARFLSEDPYYDLGNRVMGLYEINVPNVFSIMQANTLYAYCGNSPVVFIDESGFLFKEIAEAWENFKKKIRESFHSGDEYLETQYSIDTAAEGAEFLNMYADADGIYHAKFDCWQAKMGYNDLYDFFFDIGTSMEKLKYTFKSGEHEYAIWVWKGDYINLGAGGELGIYQRVTVLGIDTPQWEVNKSLAMKMSLSVKNSDGNTIIDYSPEEKQWWITGFNPNYKNVEASNLTAVYTIDFSDNKEMYNSFKETQYLSDESAWTFDDEKYIAQLTF